MFTCYLYFTYNEVLFNYYNLNIQKIKTVIRQIHFILMIITYFTFVLIIIKIILRNLEQMYENLQKYSLHKDLNFTFYLFYLYILYYL